MNRVYPHCMHCGSKLNDGDYPKACPSCGRMHFLNPLPVAVLLVPVGDGVLTIRRAIAPQIGELALPGGYIDLNETWEQAASRELEEETGLQVDPTAISHFATISSQRGDGVILIFGVAKAQPTSVLEQVTCGPETSEAIVVNHPQALAFELHTDVLAQYFEQKHR